MTPRFGIAALAAVVVLGCASSVPPERQWTRQGATPEDVKRDLYWCTGEVAERARVYDTPATTRLRTQKVDEECMQNRGYTKVAPKG